MHGPGIEAGASTEPEALEPDLDAILVTLDSDDLTRIDRQVVDLPNFRLRIEQLHTAQPDRPLVNSADKLSSNSLVIALMDAAKSVGVKRLYITAAELGNR